VANSLALPAIQLVQAYRDRGDTAAMERALGYAERLSPGALER
jgi:hypothetical protein